MPNSNQIFNVRVIPRARQNTITTDADGTIRVHTTTAPTDGKANTAVVRALAAHFGVAPSCVHIIRGETSRHKVVSIE
jgi:hypothetical protein